MGVKELLGDYGTAATFPEIAGRYAGKRLVVCGDAACVWDDLERLGCRVDEGRGSVAKEGWDFLTVNKLVEVFPGRVEHAYSNEPGLLNKFVEARRSEYKKEFGGPHHTHSCSGGAKWKWPFGGHGTSGLGGTLTGLALGYDEIMLCGLPLDNGPHNGEPHWRHCRFEASEAASPKDSTGPNPHWRRAIEHAFEGRVKSMSGRTREWLG